MFNRAKGRKLMGFKFWISLVFGIYLTMLFALTVSPVYGGTFPNLNGTMNLRPFKVLSTLPGGMLNFFGNVLMFIPMGLLLYALSGNHNPWKILWGTAVSCLIEILQLFNIRGTDIDDVILNTCGTVIGWLCGSIVFAIIHAFKKKTISKKINYSLNTVVLVLLSLMAVMIVGFYGHI